MKSAKKTSTSIRFGENVQRLRKSRGLSQEALADLAELDRSYIGGVERGERNISLNNIKKIADALQLKTYELFMDQHG